ncbi:hypothetical protein BCR37DRAFT_376481 [Protomyces lactucae-debilis]|uniref:DUF221-domain-containing protein n=1 Tax=Protomyces lactucae-debilis TaxID=2754530 RepID=A0A1Y2FV83_PROLT|nr:uncharacterized protein BCR37DRAFT_376481 [Protomyces lactucae-debilis]ORY87096.1 hypothetical protein BCR37DRAFT_376481 [Protomyces lactucae-debilis]
MNEQVDNLAGTSLKGFLASLVSSIVFAAIFLIAFILLRTKLRRFYEPRANIETLPEEKKIEPLSRRPWAWLPPVLVLFLHKKRIIEKSGMDAYYFIRFIGMVLVIFAPALLLTWPILLPLNRVGGIGSNPPSDITPVKGLDQYSFSNVDRSNTDRYWAHLVLAWLFVIWICIVVTYELHHFVRTRQNWLLSPKHRQKASATTILVTGIPKHLLDTKSLRELFSPLPGGVKNIWLNRKFAGLLNTINQRDAISRRLEGAVVMLQQRAHKKQSTQDLQRPQHRLPIASWMFSFPNWMLIGKKVDTIDWCKAELARLNPEILEKQANPNDFEPMNSAFIQFHRQISAHMAVQSVSYHKAMAMTPSYLELSPQDVLWDNMQMLWWERYIWIVGVWGLVVALVISYVIPVTFIGSLSHLTSLIELLPFLEFLNNAPSWTQGLITGLLPTLLIAIILALVPLLMRLGGRLQGWPNKSVVSLKVQNMYFLFLFVQVFLVVTISSGVTALIDTAIANPSQIPQLLATNLPKASNFFYSYLLLQGISGSAGDLLSLWSLFIFYFNKMSDSTPRSKWKQQNTLRNLTWGTKFPSVTNFAAIGIIYSIIAPLIMLFVIVAFILFAISNCYNFYYVYDFATDTGGLSYPTALMQLFTGVYFLELCLTGLFFLVRNADGSGVPCKIQGILMVVLLVLTIVFQVMVYRTYRPLAEFLPLDLNKDTREIADGEEALLSRSATDTQDGSYDENKETRHDANIAEMDIESSVSREEREVLLLEAFKHEALRRREPVLWIPRDALGVGEEQIEGLPEGVHATLQGAFLDEKGKARYEEGVFPPDYVRSDDFLL